MAIGNTLEGQTEKVKTMYRIAKDIYTVAKISSIVHGLSDQELEMWQVGTKFTFADQANLIKSKLQGIEDVSEDSDEEGCREYLCQEKLISLPDLKQIALYSLPDVWKETLNPHRYQHPTV